MKPVLYSNENITYILFVVKVKKKPAVNQTARGAFVLGSWGTGAAGPQRWPLWEQAGSDPCQTQTIPAISTEFYNRPAKQPCQAGGSSVNAFKKERKPHPDKGEG